MSGPVSMTASVKTLLSGSDLNHPKHQHLQECLSNGCQDTVPFRGKKRFTYFSTWGNDLQASRIIA